MSIDAARCGVTGDVRRELAVDGSGELVHTTLSSSSCCSPWWRIVRHPCKGQNASSVEFALSRTPVLGRRRSFPEPVPNTPARRVYEITSVEGGVGTREVGAAVRAPRL